MAFARPLGGVAHALIFQDGCWIFLFQGFRLLANEIERFVVAVDGFCLVVDGLLVERHGSSVAEGVAVAGIPEKMQIRGLAKHGLGIRATHIRDRHTVAARIVVAGGVERLVDIGHEVHQHEEGLVFAHLRIHFPASQYAFAVLNAADHIRSLRGLGVAVLIEGQLDIMPRRKMGVFVGKRADIIHPAT